MPKDAPESMEFSPPQGSAQVGSGLREVRERLGWKLPDVAAELRIRLPYLEAIERGDLAALPGPAYQTGFVRSYAQVLGLDAEEILRRFRAEGGIGMPTKAELSFLAPVPDRAVPPGAVLLLGVVLVLAGYGLWYRHSEQERRLAQAVPSVPAQLAPLAVPPKPPAAVPAPKPAPVAVAQTPVTPPGPAMVPPPSSPPPVALATPAPAPPPAAVAPPPPPPQTILATADTWVEVTDSTGNILFSKVLHAGDSWPVPDEPGLTMTAGNAGGTEISTAGKATPPLGATGTVLHAYALTPPAPKPAAPPKTGN